MRFDVASELHYAVAAPSTIIFNIQALQTRIQRVVDESLVIEPKLVYEEFASTTGDSRFVRLETGAAKTLSVSYRATVDVEHAVVDAEDLSRVPVQELAHDVVPFLFPSRYCESDRLGRFAARHFGHLAATPHACVTAIVDWVHDNVEYVRGATDAQTSAFDTVTQGAGVCRDFAHLAIAFCRALNIPARYFTGYAYRLEPPDFHACFEVYIGGRWVLFDATRLVPLNGIVRIATGRDAADASIATIFGCATLERMTVRCDIAEGEGFASLDPAALVNAGVSLDGAA